jgi:spermidine synthase
MIRRLLPSAIFLSAAASLAVELAIVRLGAPYVGQSLFPWSAAIASVLLGLTMGHILGGIVAGGATDIRRLRLRLGLAWLAAAFAASLMPGAAGFVVQSLSGEGEPGNSAVLALAALAFPPSLAIGFIAPMAVRMAVLTERAGVSRMVGAIYAASAAGSVAGTIVAGFIVLEMAGATGLIGLVCATWATLGVLVLPWRQLSAVRAATGIAIIASAIAVALILGMPGPCLLESRYTCIRLLDRLLADAGLLRFMILDEGVHSASDRDHPQRLHLGYAALADRLARTVLSEAADPRALVIGGGGATLPRAWAAQLVAPAASVTAIELDPVVAAVASDKMWAGQQSRLKTLIGDGRAVVRSLPQGGTFDVILMDAYRTHSVPPHLVTREFAALIAPRVSENGVYLSNVIDRSATPSLAFSVARTLSEVFPVVDIWIVDGEQETTTNYIVAAWKNPRSAYRSEAESVTASVMNAGGAVQSRIVKWRRVDANASAKVWPDACAIVLTDDWAPVDRLISGRSVCRRAAGR